MIITIYRDNLIPLGLATEEFCNYDNMVEVNAPEDLLRKWFEDYDYRNENDERTPFGEFMNDWCDCDDFEHFLADTGWLPERKDLCEMNYEIRIFGERFNMDPAYYLGNDDVVIREMCWDVDTLKDVWKRLLKDYEGETYSVWEFGFGKQNCLTGGAFDPGDWEYIEEAFDKERR